MRAAPVLVLLAVLALSGASPGAAEESRYETAFPAGASFEADALALLAGRSDEPLQMASFTLTAKRLRVYEGTRDYAVVQLGGSPVGFSPDSANRTYELTDVVVTFAQPPTVGFVGVHPREGAIGAFNASAAFVLESRNGTTLASNGGATAGGRDTQTDEAPDSSPEFFRAVKGPHLATSAPGHLSFSGPARVKVYGPALRLEAAENASTLETGMRHDGDLAVRTAQRRWVVLESDALTFQAGSGTPWEMALGEVRTREAILSPEGTHILPAAAPLPADPAVRWRERVSAWPLLAVGAAVAGTAGGLGWWWWWWWWWWRARAIRSAASDPAEAWDAEECVRRAEIHLESGRLERALEWLAQARRLAPTSVAACTLHALVLQRLGRADEALRAYVEAAILAQDGEPALCAARLAATSGRGEGEVEGFVVEALARSPGLVEEVDGERVFRPLRGRPRFELALAQAWRAHLTRLSGED